MIGQFSWQPNLIDNLLQPLAQIESAYHLIMQIAQRFGSREQRVVDRLSAQNGSVAGTQHPAPRSAQALRLIQLRSAALSADCRY